MRKLKVQMNMTTDGFVAGPDGQLDWMSSSMDERHLKQLHELTDSMDTILMGHGMVEEFTTYWENVLDNQPESPEYPYAVIFVDTPKIVFSRTARHVTGKNTTVENGDLVEAVSKLKNQPGKDLMVYGGAAFVATLLDHTLIDELYLFVHPVAIGNGLRIFQTRINLKLIQSTSFPNGIIANYYQPLPGQKQPTA